MSETETADPGKRLEQLYAKEQELRTLAEEAADRQHDFTARLYLRKAAGVKGAYTRLARSL